MSDFCHQCAKDMNMDTDDLAELITQEQAHRGLTAIAICEGCGPTIVDHMGYCQSKNCIESHGHLDFPGTEEGEAKG